MRLLALILLAGCHRHTVCEVPSAPSPPTDIKMAVIDGFVVVPSGDAERWAKWSDDMVTWRDLAYRCGIRDTGEVMGKWEYED